MSDSIEQKQLEILKNGPIVMGFTVYDDFQNCYQLGVYQSTLSSTFSGEAPGHAVKVIGWGEENGVPYWLAANSWGPDWGDGGFFKIRRGTNECGIESYLIAVGFPRRPGLVDLNPSVSSQVLMNPLSLYVYLVLVFLVWPWF